MTFSSQNKIQYVSGVGPKRAKLLEKLGIKTVEDILLYFPRDYVNRVNNRPIVELEIDEIISVKVHITSKGTLQSRYKKSMFKVVVSDGTGYITCIWFNASKWLQKQFEVGDEIIVMGRLQFYGKNLSITHPDVEFIEDKKKESFWSKRDLLPIYHLTEGLTNKFFRKIIFTILNGGFDSSETLPDYIRNEEKLISLSDALQKIHMPESEEDVEVAKKRLIFEELFFLQLMLARKKIHWSRAKGNSMILQKTLTTSLKNKLPFELTASQKKVLNEIVKDMNSPFQMNRLLQGDVGSGKTIISIFAMLLAVENGFQAAIMAPTEILVHQHYFALKNFLKDIPVKSIILLGGNYAGKSAIKDAVQKGEYDIVVGTHSLIQKDVKFKNLGLVIVDEQHRFGVLQRKVLSQKGQIPDKLVMSATPIPRSLALTVYGDLDVSIIDELPPNRQEIYTNWIKKAKKSKVYDFIKKEVDKGRQVYIVCPLVEESEKLNLRDATSTFEDLQNGEFAKYRLALLHGKMKNADKDRIMQKFSGGEIDVLVSTTVIEVGIDVPNATIMMIEHAERFGLSQLHQLRGRVGRGKYKSYCVLVAYYPMSDEGLIRLNTMKATNDGFKISEVDLEIRGPGEFFGTEQSGMPRFRIANIIRDRNVLEKVRKIAFKIIDEDYDLKLETNKLLRKQYKKKFAQKEKLFSF
ncbi:MAG: ATP-dependent DNA helicase RecG [Candidatus Cloacimonadota bacterium]|nr:ATP-dependent DNA helicase RecG [Candidatus Cloacimonadota bacterium]